MKVPCKPNEFFPLCTNKYTHTYIHTSQNISRTYLRSQANTRFKRQRVYDDNSSSGGDSDIQSSSDNHQLNQHNDLSILADAASRTVEIIQHIFVKKYKYNFIFKSSQDVNIETQIYPAVPQLMATTSLTWLDDDNLLDDELLFPETPVLPGSVFTII